MSTAAKASPKAAGAGEGTSSVLTAVLANRFDAIVREMTNTSSARGALRS